MCISKYVLADHSNSITCLWPICLNPYSLDLRWRIVWSYLAHKWSKLLVLFSVCERTVRRFIACFQITGDVVPCKRRHGPPLLLGEFEQMMLFGMILDKPGIYLSEIQGIQCKASLCTFLTFTYVSRLFAGLWRLWHVRVLVKLCIEQHFKDLMNSKLGLWLKYHYMMYPCSCGWMKADVTLITGSMATACKEFLPVIIACSSVALATLP
jgi:hypothetical protein